MENILQHDYSTKKNFKQVNKNINKCYTCKPRGTLKEHIISQTDNFVFNHDLFRRPLIIITSKVHYHSIDELPDVIKLELFQEIRKFVDFWNLNKNYQLMINNGESQTHHHFHVKMRINEDVANRMRRDHFTRINLEKTYEPVTNTFFELNENGVAYFSIENEEDKTI
jgi:diadenosine tetraphosphate (Ap4A) HIT family hydrolase